MDAIKIFDDVVFLGENDEKLTSFDNMYLLPDGMSFNSYLVLDEKTVLFETIERPNTENREKELSVWRLNKNPARPFSDGFYAPDSSIYGNFLKKLQSVLNGRKLDYLVIQHAEPDHTGAILDLLKLYPDVTIVISPLGKNFLVAYHPEVAKAKFILMSPASPLKTGKHVFRFIPAPLVHWPEVYFVYDEDGKVLYSSDAFGKFGKIEKLFTDPEDQDEFYLSEMRRYYANIVGKFGDSVKKALGAVSKLEIRYIFPLHGPLYRKDFSKIFDLYAKMASYTPLDPDGVMVAVGTVYGNTAAAASHFAKYFPGARFFDIAKANESYLISEAFRAKTIILASITHEGELYPVMESFLTRLKHIGLKNRVFAFVENGTWAPVAAKKMKDLVSAIPSSTLIEPVLTIKGSFREEQEETVKLISEKIREAMDHE